MITARQAKQMAENGEGAIKREICKALEKCDEDINLQILDSVEKGKYDITCSFAFGVSKHFEDLEYEVHAKFFKQVAERYFSYLGYEVSCTFNDYFGTVHLIVSWKEVE